MQRLLTIAVMLLAFGSGVLLAQTPAGTGPLPVFDAASIKLPEGIVGPIDVRFFPNRFVATRLTLSQLIEQAYGLQAQEITGVLSYQYVGHNATMAQLALALGGQLRAPVADETKLPGSYDFTVSWTYTEPFGGLQPDPNIPTIFTALERDLGLKLVADKGPVPIHVIRRALKPSAN